MDRRIHSYHVDPPNPTSENCPDSPLSGEFAPSTKKSKRKGEKRVISVRIGDMEGYRNKGETYPPSDSWTWRKYGQKPIKGSPYPRGYYRCSSSKGCPARKQVERSRVDPTLLVITYSSDHNHFSLSSAASPATTTSDLPPRLTELGDDSVLASEFCWFPDSAGSTNLLEIPICKNNCSFDFDVTMKFSMKEEDELLFADLGELPESSTFRRRFVELDDQSPMNVVPCCDGNS